MLSSSCAISATDPATPAPGGSRRSRGRSTASARSWRRSATGAGSPRPGRARRSASTGRSARETALTRPRASRAAYLVRWLELGDGIRRPAWSEFVADSPDPPRLTRPRRRARYPSRMRLSHLFFTTLRDDPADAEMPSHRLLLRAGYVRQLGSGIYSLLPLGKRVNDRVEQVIREEQNAIGGQEMEMPVVHPGRHLARERPLRRDRPGADPVQGPQRPRHGPGDDPRGGRRAAARRHRPLVAPAPACRSITSRRSGATSRAPVAASSASASS